MGLLNMRYFYLIVGLLCSIWSLEAAAELKIGFVNAARLMREAPQVESASKRLEREFAPKQRQLVSAGQEIKRLQNSLSKDGSIMSDARVRDISRQIRDKGRELKLQQASTQEDYDARFNEEFGKVQKVIREVIQQFAKDRYYDLIVSEGVVWANPRINITDDILTRLRTRGY